MSVKESTVTSTSITTISSNQQLQQQFNYSNNNYSYSLQHQDNDNDSLFFHVSLTHASVEDGSFIIDAKTNLPGFKKETYFKLAKAHIELERLFLDLQIKFHEYIIPVAPVRILDLDLYSRSVQAFLSRVMSHPVLRSSDSCKLFFDSKFQFPQPPHSPRMPQRRSAFLMGIAPAKSPEIDPFFDQAKNDTSTNEYASSRSVKSLDRLAKAERALSLGMSDMAQKLNACANHSPDFLSTTLKKFAKLYQTIELLHFTGSSNTATISQETFAYHEKSAQAALVVFDQRLQKLTAYEQACKATQKKIMVIERLKSASSIRQDKVDAALEELKEAKRIEGDLKDTLKRHSEAIRSDYERHVETQSDDMEANLNAYASRQLHGEKQLLAALLRAM